MPSKQTSVVCHSPRRALVLAALALSLGAAATSGGQNLSDFFGFSGLEVVRIDRGAGPIVLGDMNDDGLLDLIAINNFKSRIEIHYQRRNASPDDVADSGLRVNELPDHWRFRRQDITASHRIGAIVPFDYDDDGLTDLIYAGVPSEIVFVRQADRGVFQVDRRHRISGLQPNRDSLRVADVLGDERPELIAIINGEIVIHSMDGPSIQPVLTLSGGQPFTGVWVEDFSGNGRLDVLGVIPDSAAPLRLWLGAEHAGEGTLGPQLHFEMPALAACAPIRLSIPPTDANAESSTPNSDLHAPARIAVIERLSRRLVVSELVKEAMATTGDRDAAMHVFGFTDAGNRERDVAVYDIDGDGLLDLIATDTRANAVVVYRQVAGRGLQRGQSFPSLADVRSIALMDAPSESGVELFALSERENVVGRSVFEDGAVQYPVPLRIPDGRTPVAMNVVHLNGTPTLAVILKDGRDYEAAVVPLNDATATQTISLGSLSRSPDSIVPLDADQNGLTDLLLLTRDRPMMMLVARVADPAEERAGEDSEPDASSVVQVATGDSTRREDGASRPGVRYELLESRQMGQFGLVQQAADRNTAVYDIDGSGSEELLIADRNFIRAVRFVPEPPPGVGPGWQVVAQINARAADARLVSLATFDDRIIAADAQNSRLIVFKRDESAPTGWIERERIHIPGFKFDEIIAGSFSGDGQDDVLAIGEDGFAVIQLAGERYALREMSAWRTDDERRRHHAIAVGDVNSDGFTDLIVLDAGQQMLEILTFSETGNLLYATGFQVFESRIFSGGEPRQFEPSQCLIGDITGNGANDIILLCHDRVLIYPQMIEEE